MTKEKIINGCEFQSDCIEYKDISYLKIMPICAIYELSIACHDKENKCKYYQVYKQLKRLQEENEELKEKIESYNCNANCYKYKEVNKYKQALEEIIEMLMCKIYDLNENASQLDYMCYTLDKFEKIRIKILTKINEVLNDRN